MNPTSFQKDQGMPIFEHSIAMFEDNIENGNKEQFISFVLASKAHHGRFIFQSESVLSRFLDLIKKTISEIYIYD